MPNRPKDWQKIINAEAEVCHWIAPDGHSLPLHGRGVCRSAARIADDADDQ